MTSKFFTDEGNSISLTTELGSGGEGRVFAIHGKPSHVVKIYHKQPSSDHHDKIKAMVLNPPDDPTANGPLKHTSIVWPSGLVYADSRKSRFAGFIMPRIQVKGFKKIITYLSPEDRLQIFHGEFTWFHLFTTAYNLASCVAAIHEKGHCIGDLNESNFLVSPSTILSVVDCDSFQIKDPTTSKVWRCPVGKPDYTAPEIMDSNFKNIDRTSKTDDFALAVIIFQLLMEGTHPYSAKGKAVANLPTIREKILKGAFPYGKFINNIAPPDHAPPFNILHPEIQAFFFKAFDKGHKNPASRPSALDWMRILRKTNSDFTKCPQNSNHIFASHLQSCPWCARAAQRNTDSFEKTIGQQISLVDPYTQVLSEEKKIEHLIPYIKLALSDGNITSDEENYIFNLGSKLQINPDTISNIIIQEKNKLLHAKPRKVPSQKKSQPKLVVSTSSQAKTSQLAQSQPSSSLINELHNQASNLQKVVHIINITLLVLVLIVVVLIVKY